MFGLGQQLLPEKLQQDSNPWHVTPIIKAGMSAVEDSSNQQWVTGRIGWHFSADRMSGR